MKKISNEVKIGITAIITILVFIWLYNFLKGKDLFSKTANYYVVYDKVGGLAESSPVEINGYKVGVVQSVRFLDPLSGRLLVTLSVDKGFKLPVNTFAEITTATLIAGMKIQFIYGDGPGTYSSGDTIPGRLAESIFSKFENEMLPLKDKISDLISTIDSVIGSINDVMDPQFKSNLRSGIASLSNTVRSIDEAELKSTLENVNKFTQMLAENSDKLTSTFSSLESIADTLVAADIYNSVNNLKSSLEKAAVLMENLNKGQGTVGQLMTNDSLYTNLSNSLASLNMLFQDMKANPKRYVHFSIFGKKNIPEE
ncbi:MAG: MCE family protein [Bacteroidia bacterium]|nr:MAG: MCE family protein [Bacteroidia bacterium]